MGKIKDLKNIKLVDIEVGNADGEKESSNKKSEAKLIASLNLEYKTHGH